MVRKNKKLIIFFSTICLPFIILASPDWLKLNGIQPCWPVVLLLPFSLRNTPLISAIAAIFLGIFIDSFTVSYASYIPSLLILSLLWSKYGLYNKKFELFLNIGLMAILGSAVVGFSIWVQKVILYSVLRNNWFHSWSIYVLLSEVLITGLVAPFFSSWLLLTYKETNEKMFRF